MSRIGTKKPPIKNAFYAVQEHTPKMNINTQSGSINIPNRKKEDYNSSVK